MVFNRFYRGVIIRVLAIVICAIIIAITGFSTNYIHTLIVVSLMIAGLTVNLIWYVNRTNRLLSVFFTGLKESSDGFKIEALENDQTYGTLIKGIQETWDLLKESRLEKEKDHLFLKYIIGNIGNGILAYTEEGEILLANPAVCELFGFSEMHSISQLQETDKKLGELLMDNKVKSKSFARIIAKGSILELVLYISHFRLGDRDIRLASFQNINEKLSQKEIDAWQSIIKVLSHEIMSSVSPVTSLSDHLYSELERGIKEENDILNDPEFSRDLVNGLKIIAGRSHGIMEFVKKYRAVTTPIIPQLKESSLETIIKSILTLSEKEFKGLEIKQSSATNKTVFIDQGLIEQCMINLIRNSWQAMEGMEKKSVEISVFDNPSDLILSITDNGKGIEESIMDNIFIPFFTTRKDGSGVGLSFARQVMILHGGDIQVSSVFGEGTIVKLIFPHTAFSH